MNAHFAQFGPRPDEWMPFLLGFVVFMIPIIAILTTHQRRMTEIIHRQQGQGGAEEIAALRAEIARLTQAVHQNTLALDALSRGDSLPSGRTLISEPSAEPLPQHR